MTDKKKQIEGMVTALHQGLKPLRETYDTETIAEILYEAGYRKQGGWIRVDECLPEMYEDVLCFDRRSVIIDFICSDGTWCGVHDKPITHWMPLPELPRMKGGETDDRN